MLFPTLDSYISYVIIPIIVVLRVLISGAFINNFDGVFRQSNGLYKISTLNSTY
jgi:hypothetical protein